VANVAELDMMRPRAACGRANMGSRRGVGRATYRSRDAGGAEAIDLVLINWTVAASAGAAKS
jgi:hypothetical protein